MRFEIKKKMQKVISAFLSCLLALLTLTNVMAATTVSVENKTADGNITLTYMELPADLIPATFSDGVTSNDIDKDAVILESGVNVAKITFSYLKGDNWVSNHRRK